MATYDYTGNTVSLNVQYTEPIGQSDLAFTRVYYDKGAGQVLGLTQTATAATGGGFVSVTLPDIPVVNDEVFNVSVWATAVDTHNNESIIGDLVAFPITRLSLDKWGPVLEMPVIIPSEVHTFAFLAQHTALISPPPGPTGPFVTF